MTNAHELEELEMVWQVALAEAERRFRAGQRGEIGDYVALRQANDLARQTGVDWLSKTFEELIVTAQGVGARIARTQTDAHRFAVGAATMVGQQLVFTFGVRSLTIAAGWPRGPRDGFVRGGGLACAQIRHFGQPRADEDLLLVRDQDQSLHWVGIDRNNERARVPFPAAQARWHVGKFLLG